MGDLNSDPDKRPLQADAAQLHRMSEVTIAHYDRSAEAYWNGTRDHDVSQNYRSLSDAIEGYPPYSILDLGCGPGRDLHHFRSFRRSGVGCCSRKLRMSALGHKQTFWRVAFYVRFTPESGHQTGARNYRSRLSRLLSASQVQEIERVSIALAFFLLRPSIL